MKIDAKWIGALTAALTGGAAYAADLPAKVQPLPALAGDQWMLTLGAGPEVVNQFPGSKTYTVVPNGIIERWRPGEPEPFIAPDDGFGIDLLDYGSIKAGPVVRYIGRRGLSDGNGNFFGLHNIGWTAELGGFVEYWILNTFRTHIEVRQGVNGSRGLEANFSFDYVKRMGPWTFSTGPRVGYGDNQYTKAYFSVSPFEAAINPFVTPYNATAGIDSVGGLVSARYNFTPAWSTTVYGGYNRLVGDAGSSPISKNLGSRDEFTGGATLAYTFAWGGFGILGF